MSTPDSDRPATADPAAGSTPAAESARAGATTGSAGVGGAGGSGSGGGPGGSGSGGSAGGGGDEDVARRRGRAVRGVLAAALCLEALTVLLVPMTVARLGDGGLSSARLAVLLVLAGALLATAGLQRHRFGMLAGSALQVAVIATGVMVGAMYFLGLLFAGVWAYALWVRQEVGRAAARAATAPADGTGGPTA